MARYAAAAVAEFQTTGLSCFDRGVGIQMAAAVIETAAKIRRLKAGAVSHLRPFDNLRGMLQLVRNRD